MISLLIAFAIGLIGGWLLGFNRGCKGWRGRNY